MFSLKYSRQISLDLSVNHISISTPKMVKKNCKFMLNDQFRHYKTKNEKNNYVYVMWTFETNLVKKNINLWIQYAISWWSHTLTSFFSRIQFNTEIIIEKKLLHYWILYKELAKLEENKKKRAYYVSGQMFQRNNFGYYFKIKIMW